MLFRYYKVASVKKVEGSDEIKMFNVRINF